MTSTDYQQPDNYDPHRETGETTALPVTSTEEQEYVESRWIGITLGTDHMGWWWLCYGGRADEDDQRIGEGMSESAAYHSAFLFTKDHEEKINKARFDCAHLRRFVNAYERNPEEIEHGNEPISPCHEIYESWKRIYAREQERLEPLLRGFREVKP